MIYQIQAKMKVHKATINIAPLSDVCFTVLITLMVVVPVMAISGALKISLPNAHTVEMTTRETTIPITITSDNKIAVCENETDFENYLDLLKEKIEEDPDKPVVIRADKMVLHGVVLAVLRSAKILGAQNIAIATMQKGKE